MSRLTIFAKRQKETTGIFKGSNKTIVLKANGDSFCEFPASNTQPRKYKYLTINCYKYLVIWE